MIKSKYTNMAIWGMVVALATGMSLSSMMQDAPIQDSERTEIELAVEEVEYNSNDYFYTSVPNNVSKDKTVAYKGEYIPVNFIVDRESVSGTVNYGEIIGMMNKSYIDAGIQFKVGKTGELANALPTQDFSTLVEHLPCTENQITVYLVGFHQGHCIGMAVVNGYFKHEQAVVIDVTNPSTLQGIANTISHEVGHTMGLTHNSCDGHLMQTTVCEKDKGFKRNNINKIKNNYQSYLAR